MSFTSSESTGHATVLAGPPASMRAAVALAPGGTELLSVREVPTPVRVGHEVLVRVIAAGVNPIDAKTRAGGGVARALGTWPTVLGYDFSGVVVESPFGAFGLKPGDEVFGMSAFPRGGGTYAEYVSVPALSVAPKPKLLSHTDAAAIPLAALTAWGAVVEVAKAHEGQKMFINAASGGVGHFAVQFAAYFGAEVTATCSTANVGWVRSLGARHVVDYTVDRFESVVGEMDVVIDAVGDDQYSTATRSIDVLRPGGLLVTLPSAGAPAVIEAAESRGRRATGYSVSPDAGTLGVISRLISSGDVKVSADYVFDLSRVAEAHALVETGHVRGKVVLQISDY